MRSSEPEKGRRDLTWIHARAPRLVKAVLRRMLPGSMYRRLLTRHEDMSGRIWDRVSRIVGASEAILDIGAFRGDYALAARRANPDARVCAFEPTRTSARTLMTACADKAIDVVQAAVGDQDGALTFHEAASSARNSLIPDATAPTGGEQYEVQVVTIDHWAEQHGVRPRLLKIDVEGWEPAVLRGARKTLETFRPIIVCEVLSRTAGRAVMAELPGFYRFFQIDELGGVHEFPVVERRQTRNRNWLLVPEDQLAELLPVLQQIT